MFIVIIVVAGVLPIVEQQHHITGAGTERGSASKAIAACTPSRQAGRQAGHQGLATGRPQVARLQCQDRRRGGRAAGAVRTGISHVGWLAGPSGVAIERGHPLPPCGRCRPLLTPSADPMLTASPVGRLVAAPPAPATCRLHPLGRQWVTASVSSSRTGSGGRCSTT